MFPASDTFLYLHTAPYTPSPSNSLKWGAGFSSHGSEQSDSVLSMYHWWSDKKSAGEEGWQHRFSFFFNKQRSLVIYAGVSSGGRGGRGGFCCTVATAFSSQGHRIERIQKYSTSYVKKLTARFCFSQAN